jgi:hypothetical protein
MVTLADCSARVPAELRSDKSAAFLAFYDLLLRRFSDDRPFNVLEVGVFRGGSLLAFAQRLPRARILGIDISEPPARFFEEVERLRLSDRVTFRQGSQTDAPFLHQVIHETFGGEKLDIVTEDAMHTYNATRATFEAVFVEHVAAGGFYAIEDWGTGYWPTWGDGHPNGRHGMVRFVKELIDVTNVRDRTKLWQGQRALSVDQEYEGPISDAQITSGIAAFFRSKSNWMPSIDPTPWFDQRVLRRKIRRKGGQLRRSLRRSL